MSWANTGLTPGDLAGLTVGIVGLGREGRSVATMLARDVADVTLVGIDEFGGPQADIWAEEFESQVFIVKPSRPLPEGLDAAVVSPGFAPHNLVVRALDDARIVRTTGTDLFFSLHAARIIGVTGSKGKSTTSALIHHLLIAHGVDAVLGGNVGVPLWDLDAADWVVAEVSSFQASSLHHSPHTAVLTALFDEHRDWHGSFDAYARDKLNLVAHGPRHVVVNTTQQLLVDQLESRHPGLPQINVGPGHTWSVDKRGGEQWLFHDTTPVAAVSEIPLVGIHNAWNTALALAAVNTVVPLDPEITAEALRRFSPLPHRMSPVADPSGVRFLNDSLATNPPALAAALQALRDVRVVALIGGHDRGVDDGVLRDEVVAHPPAALIGLPDSGESLIERIRGWLVDAGIESTKWPVLVVASDMDDAVSHARRLARPGDVVTLSPGAPSFGRYRDYQHRGEDFIRAVNQSAHDTGGK